MGNEQRGMLEAYANGLQLPRWSAPGVATKSKVVNALVPRKAR